MLADGEGILLRPCNQIHMFFMRFPIDVIFLDRDYNIIHISHEIKPWRVSRMVMKAGSALECQAGLAVAEGLSVGQQLEFIEAG